MRRLPMTRISLTMLVCGWLVAAAESGTDCSVVCAPAATSDAERNRAACGKDLNCPSRALHPRAAHARGRLVWDMEAPCTRGKNMHTLTAKIDSRGKADYTGQTLRSPSARSSTPARFLLWERLHNSAPKSQRLRVGQLSNSASMTKFPGRLLQHGQDVNGSYETKITLPADPAYLDQRGIECRTPAEIRQRLAGQRVDALSIAGELVPS